MVLQGQCVIGKCWGQGLTNDLLMNWLATCLMLCTLATAQNETELYLTGLCTGRNLLGICHPQGTRECQSVLEEGFEVAHRCICHDYARGASCDRSLDNECDVGICPEHSNCTKRALDPECTCLEGFLSEDSLPPVGNPFRVTGCVDFDECQSSPCQHGVECVNTMGSFRCSCSGYPLSGEFCEIREYVCDGIQCQNGGRCIEQQNPPFQTQCECSAGRTGALCESLINPAIEDENCGVRLYESGSNLPLLQFEFVNCAREDKEYRLDYGLFLLPRWTNSSRYEVTDITLSASDADIQHVRYSLALMPNISAAIFETVRQLTLRNVRLSALPPGAKYMTSGHDYESISVSESTFTTMTEETLVAIIDSGDTRDANWIPQKVEISNVRGISSFDNFLEVFPNVPVRLTITGTDMRSVDSRSFQWRSTPPKTEVIDFSDNKLEKINFVVELFKVFRKSQNMRLLQLSGNKFQEISPGTLHNYPAWLGLLDLSDNQIQTVDVCALDWKDLVPSASSTQKRVNISTSRLIDLTGNTLVCNEQCDKNGWMYSAFYEPDGPHRMSVDLKGSVKCGPDQKRTIQQFYNSDEVCLREVACFDSQFVKYEEDSNAGLGKVLLGWIAGIGGFFMVGSVALACFVMRNTRQTIMQFMRNQRRRRGNHPYETDIGSIAKTVKAGPLEELVEYGASTARRTSPGSIYSAPSKR